VSSSIYRADRATHIKVVASGVLCAAVVVIVGFTARLNDASIDAANARIPVDRVVTPAGSPPRYQATRRIPSAEVPRSPTPASAMVARAYGRAHSFPFSHTADKS